MVSYWIELQTCGKLRSSPKWEISPFDTISLKKTSTADRSKYVFMLEMVRFFNMQYVLYTELWGISHTDNEILDAVAYALLEYTLEKHINILNIQYGRSTGQHISRQLRFLVLLHLNRHACLRMHWLLPSYNRPPM